MAVIVKGWAIEGSGNASTTLRRMRTLVRDAARTRDIIETARSIVRYVGPRDYFAQAQRLREWLAAHLRFTRDPKGVELLQTPAHMLTEIRKQSYVIGDCDDAATLSAALATAIGFPCYIEAVAFFSKSAPYQHVYTLVQVDRSTLVDMDTTRPARNLPPEVSRRLTVRV